MHKVIIGNWKMYPTYSDAMVLTSTLKTKLEKHHKVEIVIAPPTAWLIPVVDSWKSEHKHISFAAQSIWPEDQGAYTGDVSAYMLKDIVKYALIGHSEQRKNHHETNELVNRKVISALKWRIKPVVCIGETKRVFNEHNVRDASEWKKLFQQLEMALTNVDRHHFDDIIIAYEPVWAIGTQNPATPAYVSKVINELTTELKEIFKTGVKDLKFLYGGSVGPENVAAFLKEDNIDGLLVGGYSVKANDFETICRLASSL